MLQKPSFFLSSAKDEIDENDNTYRQDALRYTSLKDVISSYDGYRSFHHHRHCCVPSQDGFLLSEIDSSNIAIRNELVKRAASMYLNSSMINFAPDRNWFQRLCLKAKHQAVAAVDCLRPVYRIFARSS